MNEFTITTGSYPTRHYQRLYGAIARSPYVYKFLRVMQPRWNWVYVEFPKNDDVIQRIKLLPKYHRRWDPKHKVWIVNAGHIDYIRALAEWAAQTMGWFVRDYTGNCECNVYGLEVKRRLDRLYAAVQMLAGPQVAGDLAAGRAVLTGDGLKYITQEQNK